MKHDKFKGCYEVADGYSGGSRPQHFTIDSSYIEDDMTEEELGELFDDEMQTAFQQSICPEEKNRDEFIAWAKEKIAERSEEEED